MDAPCGSPSQRMSNRENHAMVSDNGWATTASNLKERRARSCTQCKKVRDQKCNCWHLKLQRMESRKTESAWCNTFVTHAANVALQFRSDIHVAGKTTLFQERVDGPSEFLEALVVTLGLVQLLLVLRPGIVPAFSDLRSST